MTAAQRTAVRAARDRAARNGVSPLRRRFPARPGFVPDAGALGERRDPSVRGREIPPLPTMAEIEMDSSILG